MAGPETIHQITEKLEVQGGEEAARAFAKLAGVANQVSKALGHTEKTVDDVGDATKDAARKGEGALDDYIDAWEKTEDAAGKAKQGTEGMNKSMFKAGLAANLVAKGIELGLEAIKAFLAKSWEVNRSFEAMQSRVQGMVMGLADWSKTDPSERTTKALQVANATLERFEKMAVKTATPIEQIEAAFAGISPVLMGIGRSQQEVLDFTEKSAAAAKVYGDDAAMAGNIVSKAIFQGVVEGETAFARAFKAQAGEIAKLKPEERMKKVTAVLEQMGGPLAAVTTDTESMLDRWTILTEGVLQRSTYPLYQRIGEAAGTIVHWMEENEKYVSDVTTELSDWVEAIITYGEGLWDAVKAIAATTGWATDLANKFKFLWSILEYVMKIIEFAGMGLKAMGAAVEVLAGDEKGFGKLVTYGKAIDLIFLEIQRKVLNVVKAFANMVVPDFVKKRIPGMEAFIDSFDKIGRGLDKRIEMTGTQLRKLEEIHGTGATTAATRAMARFEAGIGMDPEAMGKMLGGLAGKKLQVTQNIDKIEVRQDFRDQDPDRILVEFVGELERIGEAALQSTVGGPATVFGPGGTGG